MAELDAEAHAIFLSLVDRPPDEWPAALAAMCADRPNVRAKVERLLADHVLLGTISQGEDFDQPSVVTNDPEAPGSVVAGKYKLLERLGEGGFGVVYLAEQSAPVRRKVALKILKAGMDTRQVVARFEAERQALAIMDHPNIARIFDGGVTATGRPFFAMEYVKGVPITDFCDEHKLTPHQRLELFVHVCQAVQHAHQKGIIHRDLKPSNVLVSRHDTTPVVKVIDFGVAKALGQELTDKTLFTNTAQMVGTPVYMSPEQAGMSDLDIDTRSDIYSLGVLLYELLTGTTPFSKERFKKAAYDEIRRIIREEDPPKPSTRISESTEMLSSVAANRGVEPRRLGGLMRGELDWIVMKALEKDRSRRYETANSLSLDLQRYLHDEPVRACPPSTWYRVRKFAWRHKGSVLAASLLLVTLLGGIAGTTWGLVRATGARDEARRSQRDADEKLFDSYLQQAKAIRFSRRSGQRFESLDVLQRALDLAHRLNLPESRFHDLRNAVAASLARPDLQLSGPWIPWPVDAYNIAFDASLKLYARTNNRGDCSVRRVADDVELFRLPGTGLPADPILSRDGKFLAVKHRSTDLRKSGQLVHLWAIEGSTARHILTEKMAFYVAFRSDNRTLALSQTDGFIRLFELPGGTPIGAPIAPVPRHPLVHDLVFALHPTESLIAVSSYFKKEVQIREFPSGRIVESLHNQLDIGWVAWHPDGRTLAVGQAHPGMITLFDRASFKPFRTIRAPAASLSFNRAGDRLIAHGWENRLSIIDVGAGRTMFEMADPNLPQFGGYDGQIGAVREGEYGFWQFGGGSEYRLLTRTSASTDIKYKSVSLHPNGRLLAAGMSDGICLWDLADGSELAFVPVDVDGSGIQQLRFEPSGALLTTGYSGLLRWPLDIDPKAPERVVISPPKRLLPKALRIDQSQDGRVIVASNRAVASFQAYAGGWILHADHPGKPIRIDERADVLPIAVSPDGRWVATVIHRLAAIKIWSALDGGLIKQLGEGEGSEVPHFSPDSRWLATNIDGGRVHSVDDWKPGTQVGAYGRFAPDSRLTAVRVATGVIGLVDRQTGRELVRLEDPEPLELGEYFITSDADELIGVTYDKGVFIWDLRLVRERLKAMHLDWDYSELPKSSKSASVAPLRVEVSDGVPRAVRRLQQQAARLEIDRTLNKVKVAFSTYCTKIGRLFGVGMKDAAAAKSQ